MMCTTGSDLPSRISIEAIDRARVAIRDVALRTPLVAASKLSALSGREVRLKLETTQPIGAFKLRGAANAIRDGIIAWVSARRDRAIGAVPERVGRSEGRSDVSVRDRDLSGFASGRWSVDLCVCV